MRDIGSITYTAEIRANTANRRGHSFLGGIFLLVRGVNVAEEIKNCGGHEKERGCWDALFARYTVAQIYVFLQQKQKQ